MCGRFSLRSEGQAVAAQFGLAEVPDLTPRYNIAPTQPVAVVRQAEQGRALAMLRWGLVPAWADDPATGNRMINARAETAAEKPAFRNALRRRRCLVVADGFYEWQASGQGRRKQPYYIRLMDTAPFAFAGLWEHWEGQGQALDTCTILTTEPNDVVRPIHNRMPVIVPPEAYDLWLDPDTQQAGPLQTILQPYADEALIAYPVDTYVNQVGHDDPRCVAQL